MATEKARYAGREFDIPAGLSDDEAIAYIKQQLKRESEEAVLQTMKESIPQSYFGIMEGISGLPGLPADMANLGLEGLAYLGRKSGLTPDWDPEGIPFGYKQSQEMLLPKMLSGFSGRDVEIPEPKTTVGSAARKTGEYFGGSFGAAPVLSALSGVADETAEQLTGSKETGELVGAATGAIGSIPASVTRKPGSMLRERLVNVPKQEFSKAQELMDRAFALGLDLIGPEALDMPSLDQLASAVAVNPRGDAIIEAATRGRPERTERVVSGTISGVAGKPPVETIEEVRSQLPPSIEAGKQAAAAARAGVDAPRAEAARLSKDLYESAKTGYVPKEVMDMYMSKIPAQQAQEASPVERELQRLKRRLTLETTDSEGNAITVPETNVGRLDQIFKEYRDRTQLPRENPDFIDQETWRQFKPQLKGLLDVMVENSPDYKEARQFYVDRIPQMKEAQSSPAVLVGRADREPVTDIPTRDPFTPIVTILRGTADNPGDPRVVAEVARRMRDASGVNGSQAFNNVVAVDLANRFNAAAKRLSGGRPSRDVGGRFYKEVMGTPADEAVTLEMLRQASINNGLDPDELPRAFSNMMEILKRHGRIPGVGSQTQPRGAVMSEAGDTVATRAAAVSVTQPLSLFEFAFGDLRQGAQFGTMKKLAEVFTDPKSVDKMRELANLNPMSTRARTIAFGLIQPIREGGEELEDEEPVQQKKRGGLIEARKKRLLKRALVRKRQEKLKQKKRVPSAKDELKSLELERGEGRV